MVDRKKTAKPSPRPSPDIRTIARGLAHIHVDPMAERWCSLAECAIAAADTVAAQGGGLREQMAALFYEAPSLFLGRLPAGAGRMPGEDEVRRQVLAKVGCEHFLTPLVRNACEDVLAALVEAPEAWKRRVRFHLQAHFEWLICFDRIGSALVQPPVVLDFNDRLQFLVRELGRGA